MNSNMALSKRLFSSSSSSSSSVASTSFSIEIPTPIPTTHSSTSSGVPPSSGVTHNLLSLSIPKLEEFVEAHGMRKYRASQLRRWLYRDLQTDMSTLTEFSKSLRTVMSPHCRVTPPSVANEFVSTDGTVKWLFALPSQTSPQTSTSTVSSAAADDVKIDAQSQSPPPDMTFVRRNLIETVFIPEESRGTLCVSSQIGCALNCSFCATGKQGFNRNLSLDEIVGQLWYARTRLRQLSPPSSTSTSTSGSVEPLTAQNNNNDDSDSQDDSLPLTPSQDPQITNVVFMGMGEPLLNFNNVMDAVDLMGDQHGFALAPRRITISTSGVVPGLFKLADRIAAGGTSCSLAVSLHAPNNNLRDSLVPLNKKYPISELMGALRYFLTKVPGKHVWFEYVLLDEINHSDLHAKQLLNLAKSIKSKINLIPFNSFGGTVFRRPSDEKIERFKNLLLEGGVFTTVRRTRGSGIDAACGQLIGSVVDRTGRQAKLARANQL